MVLVAFGVLGWRKYTYDRACRQLAEAGIVSNADEWEEGQAFRWQFIREDWRFWPLIFENSELNWSLDYDKAATLRSLDGVANALRRVDPKSLQLFRSEALQNLDGLKGLAALTKITLSDCNALRNLDGLRQAAALQELHFLDSRLLENVDVLKGLVKLDSVNLGGCTALQNLDGLRGLNALTQLGLGKCTSLQNLDALQNLTALEVLDLSGCTGLQNIDAIKGLSALKVITLSGCTKLPTDSVKALKAALPNTSIDGP